MPNQGPSTSMTFREFLKTKADEFGVRDRHRRREEWLNAINRLLTQFQDWLRQADPEGLLDVLRYEVARTEQSLGTYDAPALKIRLGAGEVDIVPMSRGTINTGLEVATGPSTSFKGRISDPFAGRVDVTNGYQKYNLYRKLQDDNESWLIRDEHKQFTELTPDSFERILQDLLS